MRSCSNPFIDSHRTIENPSAKVDQAFHDGSGRKSVHMERISQNACSPPRKTGKVLPGARQTRRRVVDQTYLPDSIWLDCHGFHHFQHHSQRVMDNGRQVANAADAAYSRADPLWREQRHIE